MMEILPLSHKDSEGMDFKCPKRFQPSVAFAWMRDDDGAELLLIRSMSAQIWLTADGINDAAPLPRGDQSTIERLLAPNVLALQRAASIPVIKITEDDED